MYFLLQILVLKKCPYFFLKAKRLLVEQFYDPLSTGATSVGSCQKAKNKCTSLRVINPFFLNCILSICLFSTLEKIIVQGYKALGLQYFFTAGPDEVKAWTIQVRIFFHFELFQNQYQFLTRLKTFQSISTPRTD